MIRSLRSYRSLAFLLIVIVSVSVSCRKDNSKSYDYLVTSDFVVNYKLSYINNLLDIAADSLPEITNLKSYVSYDVGIYRIVYRTSVEGGNIDASGLVCVPSAPGEYPVLCFQNGTNTVNINAPSENPLNPLYQMVEAISSMGFIVVIPDYPGFGASAQIPHPYLVAEPTVTSITDMLYAVKEFIPGELQDISADNRYFLLGYSQGGWATLSLHKAIELGLMNDFNLKGSVCGAGPYNLTLLIQTMLDQPYYQMPVYIGYIINAYSYYQQFTNPVTDILNEPYASKLASLYNGTLSPDEINNQLTTSVADLLTTEFLSGFESAAKFTTVRDGLISNSISGWETQVPLYLLHGAEDKTVNPVTTENIYTEMINAGTSPGVCKKEIIPGVDHGDGIVPCMIKGLNFILNIRDNK
jgi:pimeloyl-ACP methyl ester carboxylesterase